LDTLVLIIFALVYLGMLLGEFPGLRLDRTGVALLGAIALVATGRISLADAWSAIDVSTIALLLGLMVVSAQFRLGGFYTHVTRRLGRWQVSPPFLLAALVFITGVFSAVLANDIVCLAMAPILASACASRRLDPVPFLLALACAANVGSAATLIGNPQNMLIGQALALSFAGYLAAAVVPAALGLLVTWAIIARAWRGKWEREVVLAFDEHRAPTFDRYQTIKGVAVVAALVAVFTLSSLPRDIAALAAAGYLLLSRRMATREMLALVDWQLLVLFAGLFVVNHALASEGWSAAALAALAERGADISRPAWLFGVAAALSNLVSNVPAVMLLLPAASHPGSGAVLALASTLAGNLIIVGSIANIIVVDQAARQGISIGWRTHARIGVPVTLATLGIAAGWLALVSLS
jgi:Na+/H+ antiporter NhaD/arsenite permease-like protein